MKEKYKCIEDCVLEVWDGSGDKVPIKAGQVLTMSYFEFDGSLGFESEVGELICMSSQVKCFERRG